MLLQNLDARIINAPTGELIRQLTIDPTRDDQPRNVPCGRPKKCPEPKPQVQSYSYVLTHRKRAPEGIRTPNLLIRRHRPMA
jgi:hypothetical protein